MGWNSPAAHALSMLGHVVVLILAVIVVIDHTDGGKHRVCPTCACTREARR